MKRLFTILSIPFVLAGVLLWSAAVLASAAFSAVFDRKPKVEVIR